MKLKRIICLSALLTLVLQGRAQQMSELVSEALENNLSLKSSMSKVRSVEAAAQTVEPLPDTEIGIGAFPLPVETRLGAQMLRISLVQMFPWPGLTDARIHSINVESEIELSRWDEKRNEITFDVRSSYLSLYELSRTEDIISRNIDILRDLKGLVEADISSGMRSTADAILIEARIQKLQARLEVTKQSRGKYNIELNRIMARRQFREVELSGDLSFFDPDTAFWSMARKESLNNPALSILDKKHELADSEIRKNELMGAPKFGFGVDYISVGNRDDVEISNNGRDIVQLKAMIRLPIFREQYRAREDQLLLMKESYDYAAEDVRTKLMSRIDQLKVEYENILTRYKQMQVEVELISDALDIMEGEYSVGKRDIGEILQLEIERVRLEENILKELVMSRMIEVELQKIYFK